MFDHRLAQVTHQQYLDDAEAQRRRKAQGQKRAGLRLSLTPALARAALVLTSLAVVLFLAVNAW